MITCKKFFIRVQNKRILLVYEKALNLGVIGIDHGHIFDMLDEMIKEGCSCNSFGQMGIL